MISSRPPGFRPHGCGQLQVFGARQPQQIRRVSVPSAVLVHVQEGRKHFYTRQGSWLAEAEHLLLLPAGCELDLLNQPVNGRYRALLLCPSPAALQQFSQNQPQIVADALRRPAPTQYLLPLLDPLASSWRQLIDAWQADWPAELIAHRLQEVLLTLALAGGLRPLLPQPVQRLSEQVRLLLQLEPGQDWQANELARRLHRSPATLRRQLAAEGLSFSGLLEQARLDHALALLQTSALPIGRIATQCGYASPSKFSARFRQRYGLSPSALRASQ